MVGFLFIGGGAVTLELLYRVYLRVAFPERFVSPAVDGMIMASDKSMWQYDAKYGYTYIPNQWVSDTIISGGKITNCMVEPPAVNEQGNIGPSVPDYESADYKILVVGDSFTASAINNITWPWLLQQKLDAAPGRKVRVLNIGRDGYSVLQMFDLAAGRIGELKPNLVIFAFNSTALSRGRTWRTTLGSGDAVRFVTTIQNSPTPDPALSTDTFLFAPAATHEWCEVTKNLPEKEQHKDKVFTAIFQEATFINNRSNPKPRADFYDLKASYIYDLIVHRQPFFSQWHRLPPGTNPQLTITDYRDDAGFMTSLDIIKATHIPYLLVHLPLGVSLRDGQEFLMEGAAPQLLASLERLTGEKIITLKELMAIRPDQAMRLCNAPEDCHPSKFGMNAYASAIAKVVQPYLHQ